MEDTADQTTAPTTSETQDSAPPAEASAPTPEQVEQARRLIQQAGLYVLPAEAIANIRGRAERQAEQELAQLRAQLEELKGQQPADRPAQAEDSTDPEARRLLAERQAEWERRQAEAQREIERLRADLDARSRALQERVVAGALSRLLTGAVDPELAAVWAKNKLGTLEADEAGQLVLTDRAGVTMTGAVAEQAIRDWWRTQTHLHAAPPAGPPTGNGSPAPAPASMAPGAQSGPQHPGEYQPPQDAPLSARLAYAQDYQRRLEEWKKTQETAT